jgi:hypothetical protein
MYDMARAETFTRWGDRAGCLLGLWTALPSSVMGVLTAYLAAGVGWISALGSFGLLMAGLFGFALTSIGLAQSSKWKLYRQEVKQRARLGGTSTAFDPMARVYENKRIYLRDLAPLGRKDVRNKTFINCEIIGPGTAILLMRTDPTKPPNAFKDNNTFDVDCIEVNPATFSHLAIAFWDCDFTDCNFYHMSLLFTQRLNESLHWITKDARQALLPSDAVAQLEQKNGE